MLWRVGAVALFGLDQAAPVEVAEGLLDGALGEARVVGDALVADADGRLALGAAASPEVEVDQERGGGSVVAHQVAHEHFHDVGIEREGALGCYHSKHYSRP